MSADMVFDMGSITKQFTAAAILLLEAEGRLSTNDSIARFFPVAPPDKRGITLHQLLTHSSGIISDFAGDYDQVSRDSALRAIFNVPLLAPPGREFNYSNAGFSLLAMIIEQLSGQEYERFMPSASMRRSACATVDRACRRGRHPSQPSWRRACHRRLRRVSQISARQLGLHPAGEQSAPRREHAPLRHACAAASLSRRCHTIRAGATALDPGAAVASSQAQRTMSFCPSQSAVMLGSAIVLRRRAT